MGVSGRTGRLFGRISWRNAWLMMISFAQNAEDVLLNRIFGNRTEGFYIDVGAHDPIEQSVTKHFSLKGWRGINIEPERGTDLFGRLCADRPNDINLNLGASDHEGVLTFYQTVSASSWSTFSPAQIEEMTRWGFKHVTHQIPVTTLAKICEAHVPDGLQIDFLKVDAESHEREVLLGNDWSRWRPLIVLVEDNGTHLWEPVILQANYLFAAFDGINRYYVRGENGDLLPAFKAPVNVMDNYIPHRYSRCLDLAQTEAIGPSALRVARRLQVAAVRYPRLANVARRLIG